MDLNEFFSTSADTSGSDSGAVEPHPLRLLQHACSSEKGRPGSSPVSLTYADMARCRHNWIEKNRVRAKQGEMRAMREKVRELEKQYEALCADVDAMRRNIQQTQPNNERRQEQNNLSIYQLVQQASLVNSASLHALVRETHALIRENIRLRELLERQIHFQTMVGMFVESLDDDSQEQKEPSRDRPVFVNLNAGNQSPSDECSSGSESK